MVVAPLYISWFTHRSWCQLGWAVTEKKKKKSPQSFLSHSPHMFISGLLGLFCVAVTLGPRLTEQPPSWKFEVYLHRKSLGDGSLTWAITCSSSEVTCHFHQKIIGQNESRGAVQPQWDQVVLSAGKLEHTSQITAMVGEEDGRDSQKVPETALFHAILVPFLYHFANLPPLLK